MGSPLEPLGRFARPAQQVLNVLAAGPRVPSAMQHEIDARCGLEIGPGTLFSTIARLELHALIEVIPSSQAPRAYRLTALGAETLEAQLEAIRRSAPAGGVPANGGAAR